MYFKQNVFLKEKGQISKILHFSVVESIIYLTMCTRILCGRNDYRYQSNPRSAHWKAVKKIMCYLKCSENFILCYHDKSLKTNDYTDANCKVDLDEKNIHLIMYYY